ncbi:MAG: elongation factor P [Candidatus Omnitrophica bacterium]|nr:elongation factor P [Candidatus Omnitrophota bacterium]
MIGTNQFKNGLTIMLDNQIFTIVSFQHVKPGKGGAFVRTKLKNIKTGNTIDKTFRSGEKVEQAFIEQKNLQFLYHQGGFYHFMDQETFEQMELAEDRLEDKLRFLKDNMVISMMVCKGEIIDINLPNFVTLAIKHTEPGVRADTVKATMKSATLETGAKIDVPLFIEKGNVIKIDTRTGQYVSRV